MLSGNWIAQSEFIAGTSWVAQLAGCSFGLCLRVSGGGLEKGSVWLRQIAMSAFVTLKRYLVLDQ